jgi:8-oxo-dGTP diphosphatase
VIVERNDGRILLGHRVKEGERSTWCLPGGHLEIGESVEDAARRETAEEAGITDLREVATFALGVDPRDSGGIVVLGVHALSEGIQTHSGEKHIFPEWVWVEPGKLPAPLFEASKVILGVWMGESVESPWNSYAVKASLRPSASSA